MFGFTYVYLDERLLLSLRESSRQPRYNGVWLFTEAAHIESLRREFPTLPRRSFWKSAKSGNGWVILAATTEDFEEHAFRACELILQGDRRVGRLTRGGSERIAGTATSGGTKSRSRTKSRRAALKPSDSRFELS
jgi:hypothetical protein